MPSSPLASVVLDMIGKGSVKVFCKSLMMGPLIGTIEKTATEGVIMLQMPPEPSLPGVKLPPVYLLLDEIWAVTRAHGQEGRAPSIERPT